MGGTPGSGHVRGPLEHVLARLLQGGTYVSIALVIVGSGLLIVGGTSPLAGGPPFEPGQVVADVAALRPAGLLWLGLLGVLLTPAARVVVAAAGLWRRGERTYAAVGAMTFVVIAVGVVLGVVAR